MPYKTRGWVVTVCGKTCFGHLLIQVFIFLEYICLRTYLVQHNIRDSRSVYCPVRVELESIPSQLSMYNRDP